MTPLHVICGLDPLQSKILATPMTTTTITTTSEHARRLLISDAKLALPIFRARQKKQDDEKKLPLESITSSMTSSKFMLSTPSHKLENVTSSEPIPLTTTAKATESKFLKLPRNLESSCWLNPCEDKKGDFENKMKTLCELPEAATK